MRLAYAAAAVAEVDEALAYYKAIDPNLSKRMVREIDAALNRIQQFPDSWHPLGAGLRGHQRKVAQMTPADDLNKIVKPLWYKIIFSITRVYAGSSCATLRWRPLAPTAAQVVSVCTCLYRRHRHHCDRRLCQQPPSHRLLARPAEPRLTTF